MARSEVSAKEGVGSIAASAIPGRQPYRPDIDGLRALAIVLVVGYHVGLPGFEGGFIGVDVFFVLSGYLITGLLIREVRESGRISFLDFYVRRIRRLLPALALVVLVTLILGGFVLMPWELERTARSAVATGAFASNIYFWRVTSGYFGLGAEAQPLLHTWSLAVEEQFYLVWPVLIAGGYWLGRRRPKAGLRWVAGVLTLTCVLSFVLSIEMASRMPLAGFFLMPPRLWELGVGGLLAVCGARLEREQRRLGALWVVGGLVVIALTDLTVTSAGMWPGLPALAPVLGTVAVVLGGIDRGPGNPASRLLAVGPVVAIGRLSYSWYLWHWPLLVFARLATLAQDLTRDTLIALGALGLAALTYRFVEQPIRQRQFQLVRTPRPTLVVGATLVLTMIVGGVAAARIADRLAATDRYSPYVEAISNHDRDCSVPEVECVRARTEDSGVVALLGDSHAGSWTPGLVEATTSLGMGLRVGTWGGCPFIKDIEVWDPVLHHAAGGCAARVGAWLGFVLDPANDVRIVVIANFSLPGRQLTKPTDTTDLTDGDRRLPMDEAIDAWETGLRHTVTTLTSAGIRVIVLQTVPGVGKPVPDCVPREGVARCSVDRATIDRYRDPVIRAEHRAIEGNHRAQVWDPEDLFCTRSRCLPEAEGMVFYADTNHPTAAKTLSAAPVIEQLLREAR